MKKNDANDDGLKCLITGYRKSFQIPENILYYSEQDFKAAERHFIKMMLHKGSLSASPPNDPEPQ